MSVVAQTLDRLKEAGFHWATRSGMTVAIGDVIIPPEKEEILLRHEIEAERVEKAYQRGNLSPRRAQRRPGEDLGGGHQGDRGGHPRGVPEGQPGLHPGCRRCRR